MIRSRPLRLLLTCLGTALALAGALAVPATRPTYQERYRPHSTDGRVGQTLTTRDFRIRVKQVVLANSLVATEHDWGKPAVRKRIGTDGVWVVIVADVSAMRKKISSANGLEGGELHTADGSVYRKESSLPSIDYLTDTDDLIPLGPPRTERFFFQVPRDRLTGARFQVTLDQLKWWDDLQPWDEQWFLPAADVDLGLDDPARTRAALSHAAENYPVPGQVY